jgi:hypothetical protein
MRSARTILPLGAAALAAACATTPASVPLRGEAAELSSLEGEWRGEYSSGATGRSGIIVFQLTAGEETAKGEVWMTPKRNRPEPGSYVDPLGMDDSQILTIRFVAVEDGFVTGSIDPYTDPETGGVLLTIFRGRLEGDVIEGSFVTEVEASGDQATGHWKVQRKK